MIYLNDQNKSEDRINFSVKSVIPSEVPNLILELSEFYLLKIFMKEFDRLKTENPAYFTNECSEDEGRKELVKNIRDKLQEVKIIPEISLGELLGNFPEIKKDFLKSFIQEEREKIESLFLEIIKSLILERQQTNSV